MRARMARSTTWVSSVLPDEAVADLANDPGRGGASAVMAPMRAGGAGGAGGAGAGTDTASAAGGAGASVSTASTAWASGAGELCRERTMGGLACWRGGATDLAGAGMTCIAGAGSSCGAGSIAWTAARSAVSDCTVGWGDSSVGNGRSCHAMPTARTIEAASEAGAIQRIRGLAASCEVFAGRTATCAAARMLASRSGPGAVRPCKRGNDLASVRSSASRGRGEFAGCGGRRVMPAASHAVCPSHSEGATSRSRGQRR